MRRQAKTPLMVLRAGLGRLRAMAASARASATPASTTSRVGALASAGFSPAAIARISTTWAAASFLALAMMPPVTGGFTHAALAATGNAPTFRLQRPPEDAPVDVLAETLIYDHDRDIATAVGRVRIIWGPYLLLARKVVYHRRSDRFEAEGEVYLREPGGNVLLAELVNIDKRFRDGFARHLRLLMTNGATLKARYAVRRESNITVYTDVAYTACQTCRLADGTPLWEITSKQATHDQRKGRIYHRDMTLRFAGTPVFWLPWLSHPDPDHPRSTGFLIPSGTYTRSRGLSVNVPYFINLAPNYDITLLPQINTRQGLLARARWRHNVGPGTYQVEAGAIRQMDRRAMPVGERQRLRWFARAEGRFDINRRWQWGFSGAVQSDRAMMRRYGIGSDNVIHSHAWLQGLEGSNYFRGELGHYKGLNDSDDNALDPATLPFIWQEYTFQPAVLGGVLGITSSVYSIWRRSAGMPFTAAPLAQRNTRLVSTLHWRREWISDAGLLVQPFAELRGEMRAVRNLPDIANPLNTLSEEVTLRAFPRAGVDVRWPLLGRFDGGYQVLSPVAQLIFATNEYDRRRVGNEDSIAPRYNASSLFLHDRFAGFDRFEGGVRLNAGLTWSIHGDDGSAMRFTLGQSLHLLGRNSFDGSSVGLGGNRSDIVAGLSVTTGDRFLLSWNGRFDPRSLRPRDQEAELDIIFRQLTLNLKYAYLTARPELGQPGNDSQFSGSAEWRFMDNWRLFGGMNFNMQDEWRAKRYIGIGFDCDCFRASITYSEGVSSGTDTTFDRSISLDIELKTLGSSGVSTTGQ